MLKCVDLMMNSCCYCVGKIEQETTDLSTKYFCCCFTYTFLVFSSNTNTMIMICPRPPTTKQPRCSLCYEFIKILVGIFEEESSNIYICASGGSVVPPVLNNRDLHVFLQHFNQFSSTFAIIPSYNNNVLSKLKTFLMTFIFGKFCFQGK